MPEPSVHRNNLVEARKHKTKCSGQVPPVKSEPVAETVGSAPGIVKLTDCRLFSAFLHEAKRPFRKGLSGRCRCGSRKVVETDLEPPCGRRPPDRDGGGPLLCASRGSFPFIEKVFADSGYAGEKIATATVIAVEIVRKSPDQVGFAVQPRRWVVERFFAWINRNRRLAKDFEASIASARAFLYAASVMLLVRRWARAA